MSFCQVETFIVACSQERSTMTGPRTWNMREPPAPSATTFTTIAGSRPDRAPSARASAVDRLWMATSRLATSFIRMPLPNAPTS